MRSGLEIRDRMTKVLPANQFTEICFALIAKPLQSEFLPNGGFDESHNQPQKTLSLLILCDCDKQRIAMDSVPEVNMEP